MYNVCMCEWHAWMHIVCAWHECIHGCVDDVRMGGQMYAWMHGNMHACVCVCKHAWTCVHMYEMMDLCMHACVYGCMYVWMDGWMFACMHACVYIYMHGWKDDMYGCVDGCMDVRSMYACMCVVTDVQYVQHGYKMCVWHGWMMYVYNECLVHVRMYGLYVGN